MRILVATDQWFPDHVGGVARVATDTARGWASVGHEVVVIAPRRAGSPRESSQDDRLTLHRVLPRGRLPQTFSDPVATRRFASQLADGGFDVVVAHCSTTARGLLGSGIEAPLVYVFHASAAAEARHRRGMVSPGRDWLSAALLERPLRRFTADAVAAAASVLVLSEFSRRVLSDLSLPAGQRAVSVSGAVDTDRFTPAGRDEARVLLGVGPDTRLVFTVRRYEPRMGLENVAAAARLLGDLADVRIVVAGGGQPREFERLARDAGVELLGRVPDDLLPAWHRAADLFLLPTIAYEGFGLVTAEALASGTPVVGTPVGATPELLEPLEPRLVASGTDARALAKAVRAGLELATPELRRRCRSYALERLSWTTVLPAWERALEAASRTGRVPVRAHAVSDVPDRT